MFISHPNPPPERLTTGHKLHHDVGAPAVGADKGQVAGSGPDSKRRLKQRVHCAAGQIPGVPANAAEGKQWAPCQLASWGGDILRRYKETTEVTHATLEQDI